MGWLVRSADPPIDVVPLTSVKCPYRNSPFRTNTRHMEATKPLECSWRVPREVPCLNERCVHVWCVAIDPPENRTSQLLEVLAADEREQAARMRIEHVRRRFVAHRAALRQLLGRYVNAAPETIRFDRGEHGKPSLASPWAASRIRFSATHSGGMALLALALDDDLGVDVEHIRPVPEYENLCRRYFATQEQEIFFGIPEAERPRAFFHAWTRKEAIMKALGTGISVGIDQVIVSLEPGAMPRAISIRGSTAAAAQWTLVELDPDAEYVAVLARPTGPWTVECFHWIGV